MNLHFDPYASQFLRAAAGLSQVHWPLNSPVQPYLGSDARQPPAAQSMVVPFIGPSHVCGPRSPPHGAAEPEGLADAVLKIAWYDGVVAAAVSAAVSAAASAAGFASGTITHPAGLVASWMVEEADTAAPLDRTAAVQAASEAMRADAPQSPVVRILETSTTERVMRSVQGHSMSGESSPSFSVMLFCCRCGRNDGLYL